MYMLKNETDFTVYLPLNVDFISEIEWGLGQICVKLHVILYINMEW